MAAREIHAHQASQNFNRRSLRDKYLTNPRQGHPTPCFRYTARHSSTYKRSTIAVFEMAMMQPVVYPSGAVDQSDQYQILDKVDSGKIAGSAFLRYYTANTSSQVLFVVYLFQGR